MTSDLTTEKPNQQFSADNHAVPAGYWRGWSDDGNTVWAYRLLVSHEKVPDWKRQPVRSLLTYMHLYTSVRGGAESDVVERWLNDEFESPAADALARVRADEPLTADHWKSLERYVFALDVRTPGNYFESIKRWEEQLPGMLRDTMRRATSISEAERARRVAKSGNVATVAESLPLRVWTERQPGGGGTLHAEIVAARELWLHSIKHTLTETIKKLPKLTWLILCPYRDSEWFTSDHPVLRLGYNSDEDYDFGGGWGRKGCEVIFPLSPRHLMYAKVGSDQLIGGELTREMTWKFQRLIAERADRWIINRTNSKRPLMFRKRHVSQQAFDAEEAIRKEWHDRQTTAETTRTDQSA